MFCFFSVLRKSFLTLQKQKSSVEVIGSCLWKIKCWNAGRNSLTEAFCRQTVNDKQTELHPPVFSLPHPSVLPTTFSSWPGHASHPASTPTSHTSSAARRQLWGASDSSIVVFTRLCKTALLKRKRKESSAQRGCCWVTAAKMHHECESTLRKQLHEEKWMLVICTCRNWVVIKHQ